MHCSMDLSGYVSHWQTTMLTWAHIPDLTAADTCYFNMGNSRKIRQREWHRKYIYAWRPMQPYWLLTHPATAVANYFSRHAALYSAIALNFQITGQGHKEKQRKTDQAGKLSANNIKKFNAVPEWASHEFWSLLQPCTSSFLDFIWDPVQTQRSLYTLGARVGFLEPGPSLGGSGTLECRFYPDS